MFPKNFCSDCLNKENCSIPGETVSLSYMVEKKMSTAPSNDVQQPYIEIKFSQNRDKTPSDAIDVEVSHCYDGKFGSSELKPLELGVNPEEELPSLGSTKSIEKGVIIESGKVLFSEILSKEGYDTGSIELTGVLKCSALPRQYDMKLTLSWTFTPEQSE